MPNSPRPIATPPAWTVGDLRVHRVDEVTLPPATGPWLLPSATAQVVDQAPWLRPDFADEAGVLRLASHSFAVVVDGLRIVVDTGIGNGKSRANPAWDHLDSDYLARLARAGVRPDDVDLVINTHLHVDHVGWNTFLDGGVWTPTFPRATYLMPRRDFEFWDPARGHTPRLGRGNQNVFEDSVAPVHEAGQTLLWDDGHTIDANLRLELAPGHTPGSAVLKLASGGDRAVFVGDLLHTPLQFVEPDVNSCFCEDPVRARASRHRLLGWAADHRALVLPAHLGGHGGAEVSRRGAGFAIRKWAPFSRL
ncbi:MBL fold metallo-hydrolase [Streptomyces sp. AC563]|uniref:MBL fold metallo-hydrolase n=1 Tax=Streptomyces buecherae TaxID=2763006 RepID=UPI00164D78A9|nr:MBL fold metallo-hydrolase [Streptomyces buecherae]MBC3993333.1 MBL fold metallo-hydrolase [Streptomyces buecherae]